MIIKEDKEYSVITCDGVDVLYKNMMNKTTYGDIVEVVNDIRFNFNNYNYRINDYLYVTFKIHFLNNIENIIFYVKTQNLLEDKDKEEKIDDWLKRNSYSFLDGYVHRVKKEMEIKEAREKKLKEDKENKKQGNEILEEIKQIISQYEKSRFIYIDNKVIIVLEDKLFYESKTLFLNSMDTETLKELKIILNKLKKYGEKTT